MTAGHLAVLTVLAIGTTARFTRLITADSITDPARAWVNGRAERKLGRRWTWFDDLINCPWCVSVWCSVPVAYVTVVWPGNRFVLGGLVACTASWVAANVQVREPDRTPAQARAVVALVTVGYTRLSAVAAVLNDDLTLLVVDDSSRGLAARDGRVPLVHGEQERQAIRQRSRPGRSGRTD